MRGIAGLVCPECGRAARSERSLGRARVRWGGVAVAAVMLGPAWVLWYTPEARKHGWVALVPSVALASGPLDVEAWVRGRAKDIAGEELDRRRELGRHGAITNWILARRVCAMLEAEKREGEAVEVFPIGDLLWKVVDSETFSGFGGFASAGVDERDVRNMVTWLVREPDWTDNGGEAARAEGIAGRLFVRGSDDLRAEVRGLLAAIRACEPWRISDDGKRQRIAVMSGQRVVEWNDVTIVGPTLAIGERGDWKSSRLIMYGLEVHLRDMRDVLTTVVRLEDWADNGGDAGNILAFDGKLLIRAPRETRERCVEVLRAIRACTPERREVVSGDVSIVRLDRLVDRGRPREEQLRDVRNVMTSCVETDAWDDNGGDLARMFLFSDQLILHGDERVVRRTREVLDGLLACTQDGKPRNLGGFRRLDAKGRDWGMEYVAMWNVQTLLERWGSLSPAAFDELRSKWIDEREIMNAREQGCNRAIREGRLVDLDGDAFQTITKHRLARIDPDAWGEDAKISLLGNVAVLWTTRPEMVGKVGFALRDASGGPWSGEVSLEFAGGVGLKHE